MPPTWWLATLLVFIYGAILGASYFAFFGPQIAGHFGSELLGALIGSAITALASTAIWVLAVWNAAQERKQEVENLRKAIWNEVMRLKDWSFREHFWWKKKFSGNKTFLIEERLFSGVSMSIFDNNLNLIPKLPIRAIDQLMITKATIDILINLRRAFYENQEKLDTLHSKSKISEDFFISAQRKNADNIIHVLIKLSFRCRESSKFLDVGGIFENERKNSFSQSERQQRDKEENEMNKALDNFFKN